MIDYLPEDPEYGEIAPMSYLFVSTQPLLAATQGHLTEA